MTTAYIVDSLRIFTGETVELTPRDPVKRNMVLTPPPEGEGYHIWDGHKWFTRTERPAPPPVPVDYMKLEAQAIEKANKMVLQETVAAKIEDLPDEDKATLTYLFDEWSGEGVALKIGMIVRFGDIPYRVLQDHTTQLDWTPDTVASLYTPLRQTQGATPDEWVAPTGGHDAYQTGDRVTFNGAVYESLIDANVHSPSAYPAGWQLVE